MTGTPQSRRHFLSTLAASLGAAAFFVPASVPERARVALAGPIKGQHFDAVVVDDLPPYTFKALYARDGRFVAERDDGAILWSADGVHWDSKRDVW